MGVKFKVVGDVDMDVDGGFWVVWLQELRKMPIAVLRLENIKFCERILLILNTK